MKRLFLAVIALLAITGVTMWILGSEPEIDKETVKHIKLVSRFKETLPKAEAGDRMAQYEVAKMYEEGDGVGLDMHEAVRWYMKAAEQAYPDARYKIGWLYANGIGLRQNYAEAAKWYRIASTFDNHTESQFRLGEMYFNGRGVEHDYGKAIQYYKMAASKGHAAAQFILGSMYIEGWGVGRDLIAAYAWLTLSNDNRDQALAINPRYDAVKKLNVLVPKMNRFQIDKAEQLLIELRRQIAAKAAAGK